jgi:branched-chain amino acid aminotransferase
VGFERAKWVWKNGEIVPWASASIHVSSHALHYGSGVFEGIRCYGTQAGPAVFRLDAHLARLYNSATVYGIRIPYTEQELASATCEVICQNRFGSCYVRPICFYGSDSLAVDPLRCPVEVAILAWPWEPLLGSANIEKGVRVTVSPWTKFHSSMLPTTAKACGQYLNSMLALRDAVERGFDEAILLDLDGKLAEGSGENIFLMRGGKLLTNDEEDSILLGVTRDSVIRIARDLGLAVEVCSLYSDDLLGAEEAFFTGTASEVTPIREVDGIPVGKGVRGPVTQEIQRVFYEATAGRNPKYESWLRLVGRWPYERPTFRTRTLSENDTRD